MRRNISLSIFVVTYSTLFIRWKWICSNFWCHRRCLSLRQKVTASITCINLLSLGKYLRLLSLYYWVHRYVRLAWQYVRRIRNNRFRFKVIIWDYSWIIIRNLSMNSWVIRLFSHLIIALISLYTFLPFSTLVWQTSLPSW